MTAFLMSANRRRTLQGEGTGVALYSLAPDPAPTVDAFFVDQLNACGTVEPTINGHYNGCAQFPGNFLVEDSTAAELHPAELMGHELVHNLDLADCG
jgi:hypothetical protein